MTPGKNILNDFLSTILLTNAHYCLTALFLTEEETAVSKRLRIFPPFSISSAETLILIYLKNIPIYMRYTVLMQLSF